MTDERKSQITALRTAIMRRVEFEQCIHASSIEDEIGKWVKEILWPQFMHPMITVQPELIHEVKVKPGGLSFQERCDKQTANLAKAIEEQRQQRRAQTLAQPTFNQQIGNLGVEIGVEIGGAGGDMPLTTVVIRRETNSTGQIIEVVAKSDGTTYRRIA